MEAREVIYENGVLRPVRPLDLPDGTHLEVTMSAIAEPAEGQKQIDEVDEETYVAFLQKLDKMAALPLESLPQPHASRDHDAILYPTQGTMP